MKRTGLVSVSFRDHSAREIVLAVRQSRLSYIEWGSDVHAPCDDLGRLEEIADLCRRNGIGISSYGSYFRVGENQPQEIQSYIDAARLLGTSVIRIWCGNRGYCSYTKPEFETLVNECKALAKTAESQEVILCLECHNDTVTDCAAGAVELMERVDSPFFQMYWQPNQLKTTEENLNYAKAVSRYIKIVHVFNWKEDRRFPLQSAKNIWKQYLSCFGDDVICLLEFMPDNRIESLADEAKSLMEIVGDQC